MKKSVSNLWVLVFIFLPLFFWAVGDFPRRTILKEAISIITLLSFSLMLGQLYLVRTNLKIFKAHKMSAVLKIHKVIGYIFVSLLLIHPFFIVVPRYFEPGIEPMEAFTTMLTNFNSTGIILGIIAWSLILILGITSIFRKKLGVKYKSWRVFHGILSILFVSIATWHAITLGRHTDLILSIFFIVLAVGGILSLLNIYLMQAMKNKKSHA